MEEWDPEKENDPEKVQQDFLKKGAEFLERLNADRKREEERHLEAIPPGSTVAAFSYKPPTFAQVSARIKRAWEETKKIDPEAPALVQVKILELLFQVNWEEDQIT